jgi:hypothetical protein
MKLENIILHEVIQVHKDKGTYFLSYVGYRLNTYTSNIMKTDHAKGTYKRVRVKEGSYIGQYS